MKPSKAKEGIDAVNLWAALMVSIRLAGCRNSSSDWARKVLGRYLIRKDDTDTPTWIHPYRALKPDLKMIYLPISIC